MKTPAKLLLVLAATSFALFGTARAQLQTYETQNGYFGSTFTFSTFGGTMGETFTNVSSVASLTFNFFAGSGNGNVANATSLTTTFGEWNGTGFVSGSTVTFGTILVPASTDAAWANNLSITGQSFKNYSVLFDFTTLTSSLINSNYGYLTSASKTYAFLLTDLSGGTSNLALGANFSNTFQYGAGYPLGGTSDLVFSEIAVAPGNQQLVPTPEAGTVATLVAATLVAALVGFRLYQRRKLELVPAPVVAA